MKLFDLINDDFETPDFIRQILNDCFWELV